MNGVARLAVVAALTWAVAFGAVWLPGASAVLVAGCGSGAVALLVLTLRGVQPARVTAVFAIALAAAAIAAGHVWAEQPGRDALAAHEGATTAEVRVTASVAQAWPGAWRFAGRARLDSGERGDVVVLFTGERPDGLDVGAVVSVRGTTGPARTGERAVIRIRAARPPGLIERAGGAHAVAAGLRHGLAERSALLPGAGAALLPGLAVGDTSAVSDDLDQAMKTSSLSHLTAVSGSNCAIVVGAAFALAARCRAPRWARVSIALTALAGFVVLVTPEPSVVRAAAMATTAMLALLLGRTREGAAILGTAVTVLLCADPWLSTSIGFLLSVAATAALLLLARPITRTLSRVMPVSVAIVIAVPLAAQLVCSPILIILTPAVSVWGVLANVVAAPAAPLATVLGLLACLTAPVPFVGAASSALAWVPAQWVGSTAELFAGLPVASVAWFDGVGGALALAAVCAAVAAVLIGVRRRAVRLSAVGVIAVTVGVASGLWAVRSVVLPVTTPPDWSMAVCDVGQGDAIVLRSTDRVALVDTGRDPALLGDCLDRLRIGRIDLLVLTHFDADHAGGASAVIGRAGIVVHSPPGDAQHGRLLDEFRVAGSAIHPAVPGDELTVGTARVRVVWPPLGAPAGNDASVVVEWDDRALRAILLGDLSGQAQQRLLASRALRPPYPVVKVAHHGSADQWPRLYAALGSSLAIVPVGADNDYGHPRAETLEIVRNLGMAVARTDRSGLLLVSAQSAGLSLWRERMDAG